MLQAVHARSAHLRRPAPSGSPHSPATATALPPAVSPLLDLCSSRTARLLPPPPRIARRRAQAGSVRRQATVLSGPRPTAHIHLLHPSRIRIRSSSSRLQAAALSGIRPTAYNHPLRPCRIHIRSSSSSRKSKSSMCTMMFNGTRQTTPTHLPHPSPTHGPRGTAMLSSPPQTALIRPPHPSPTRGLRRL